MSTNHKFNVTLGLCVAALMSLLPSTVKAQEAPCPFADDEIIVYVSPSTFANVPSVKEAYQSANLDAVLDKAASELDAKINEALADNPEQKKYFNFIADFVKNDANESSAVKAALKCYFKYVDGVVVALDIPELGEKPDPQAVLAGLSLTYVLNEDPNGLDVDSVLKSGENYEIVKNADGKKIVKIKIKKDGKQIDVFFATTKVKDVDKYVAVLSGTQELVEKKIDRFQGSNKFVVDRLDAKAISCVVLKTELFDGIIAQLAKHEDQIEGPGKVAYNLFKKVQSFKAQTVGDAEGLCTTLTLEMRDAKSAKDVFDLANGGLAAARLSLKGKENPSEDEKNAIEILDSNVLSHEEGSTTVTLKAPFGIKYMKIVAQKISEQSQR